MSDRPATARRVATRVLFRVANEGAWAAPALDAEIARARLDRRDAALATEIVYGALRVLPRLDAILDAHLSKPKKVDPYLRAALRAGAYQLVHLSRVPPHAVVSDAVALVKAERGARLGGVANAVLRKVAAARPAEPEPPRRIEVPPWIEQSFVRSLGKERADLFLCARELPPPLGLRAVGIRASELEADIRAQRPEAEVGTSDCAPNAVWARGAGDPRALERFASGNIVVQELGSQLVAALVGAREGERVADVCAGHGNKTLVLAERVGASGEIVAVDLYEEKLERLEEERARLGLSVAIETLAVDLSVGTGGLSPRFDRVLIDAPCTGLGTLHRRPELALRLSAGDPARLAALQLSLLASAASLVRPDGLLVYAVCSPSEEEGIRVVETIEARLPELERVSVLPGDPLTADADGIVRIGPWSTSSAAPDAYQVARWICRHTGAKVAQDVG